MKKFFSILLLIPSFIFGQLQLEGAFPNLSFSNPVDLQNAGDGTDRIFVVEQNGIIRVFQNSSNVSTTKQFLNITDRVSSGGEMGLLGLAFHPDYEVNGYFYVNYTRTNPRRQSVIARFSVSSANPDSSDKNSELILLVIDQPFPNHNGGQVAFGPDGYLYMSFGDGGSSGDPNNNAQNRASHLGKILRINVDSTEAGLNYSIPPDNPYANNTQGFKREIFAYGLRNPWRFSIDFVTSWIWCGDVGQGSLEEVDIIQNGKNYGWRCYEGNHVYNDSGCSGSDYTFPIQEYSHGLGISITGGYVYRGSNVPEIYGKYIYADYGSKRVWALNYDGVNPASNELLFIASSGSITSFGVDQNYELYICSFDGKIYKFTTLTGVPVELIALSAEVKKGNIILKWKTATEINNRGFEIERSLSSFFKEGGKGAVWVTVGFVKGNGTTTEKSSYQFIDDFKNNEFEGTARYRLKQIDFDGTFNYSNEVAVDISFFRQDYFLRQNYPNPFNPSTNIRYNIPEESKVEIEVTDVLGNVVTKLLDETKQSGFYEQNWNASLYASGVYFIRMKAESLITGRIFYSAVKTLFIK